MDNSIYVMLSRQTALFRKMDVIANNIANMNTTGYHAEKVIFDDYLVDAGGKYKNEKIAFTQDIASYRDTSQGQIKITGNSLDVAINGDGYFMVETPLGIRYTRSGNFQLDAEGVLTTVEGYPVVDTAGQRIEFTAEDKVIKINDYGLITVDGEERATLGIAEFANPQTLEQVGNNILKANANPLPPVNSRVVHGALESSNVSAVKEVVEMTRTSRSVGSTAKFIEVMYDLQRKASAAYTQQSNT